ncbi:hypothetical protein BRADI_1g78817v3 [Brachypodium distachyon]|uniref:Uncharacterized protein n=1 Tax=Brachypodium distachyon TaxID=15368 RepID=A0A0Q3LLQ8_BRADI|nr:hypothetical protein BRADI_1g78817v3 [Brachypodium distachyon]
MAAILGKKNMSAMCLAALMVMATILSSCHAGRGQVDRQSDPCLRTILGCSLPTCSKVCNFVEGAHCTDIDLCSCCPSAAKSGNADKKAVTN